MLPGFRFLFAAIILSMSVLIFGLGAAAWLRAAHIEFANLPSRRAQPEPVFIRPNDNQMPTLALLRVDPPVAEKPMEDVPAAVIPEKAPDILAPAGQAADVAPAQPEKLAALKPEEPTPVEAAKPEIPATEAAAETPVPTAETKAQAAETDVKVAPIAEVPAPPPMTASAPAEPATGLLALEGNVAATRIATLGGPAVLIDEKTSARTTDAQPDRSALKKRASQRARERRRLARRARLAREAALALQQQQTNNPFAQAPITRATR